MGGNRSARREPVGLVPSLRLLTIATILFHTIAFKSSGAEKQGEEKPSPSFRSATTSGAYQSGEQGRHFRSGEAAAGDQRIPELDDQIALLAHELLALAPTIVDQSRRRVTPPSVAHRIRAGQADVLHRQRPDAIDGARV